MTSKILGQPAPYPVNFLDLSHVLDMLYSLFLLGVCKTILAVIIKIIFDVPDKMSDRCPVLCRTF